MRRRRRMSGDEDKGCDRVVKKPRREAGLQPNGQHEGHASPPAPPGPAVRPHPPPFFSKTDVIQTFMALRAEILTSRSTYIRR